MPLCLMLRMFSDFIWLFPSLTLSFSYLLLVAKVLPACMPESSLASSNFTLSSFNISKALIIVFHNP